MHLEEATSFSSLSPQLVSEGLGHTILLSLPPRRIRAEHCFHEFELMPFTFLYTTLNGFFSGHLLTLGASFSSLEVFIL
jgi:hypothetical protein